MQLSEKIQRDHLHHAYVVESSLEEGTAALRELIEAFGIATRGNPDFHEYILDVFLLEHAHMLRQEQSFHGADGAKKIFIVAFNTIGHEAQNALLKTFEEPTEGAHFFFVTRTSSIFLPTLLSRVQVIRNQSVVSSLPRSSASLTTRGQQSGEKFLTATISGRMKMIEPMVKAKSEEKSKAREETRLFLEFLERALYKNSDPRTALCNSKHVSALGHVLFAERALLERSPSLKLLLEHLALTVPKISW